METVKGFTQGTHRICSPAETWERIKPHFLKAGLTRVADATGLDRVGIPVTLAFRPDSPTMANSTGKGLTLEAALVSGAMEAMELYHAEQVEIPVVRCSYEEMARCSVVPALEDLPLQRLSLFTPRTPECWVLGHDLLGGGEVAVPIDLVAMSNPVFKSVGHLLSFQMGSNGLASGNQLPEAIVAALLEVVERDAVTSYKVAEHQKGPPPRVRLETVKAPLVQVLLERLEAAGVTPILYDCRVDTEVPVYLCHLYDAEFRQVGICMGYGAHLDPEIAMLRALTEAVQARVVIIAGSRDDIFRRRLSQFHAADTRTQLDAALQIPATVDAGELVSEAADTFEGDIDVLVAKLRQAGLHHVITFDLSRPEFPFSVARVVVPGLEGYMFDLYTPGRRARAMVRQRETAAACG
jgi:ribosomal protein S12 methylthiotransferase accessory factor